MTRSKYLLVGRRTFRSRTGAPVRGVFNAASATLFLVPEDLAATLGDRTAQLSEAQSAALENAGALVAPDHHDEYLRELRAASADLSSRTFILLPTPACNMGCSYCGQSHTGRSLKSGYADLVVPRISAVIDDPVTTEINVNWFGGEPLLAREQVFSIARTVRARAAARGVAYRSQLTTNGSLFTQQLVEDLVCEAGVTRIDVTVDGPRRVHDASRRMKNGTSTYDRILDSVGWALDQDWARRCTFVLRTNITAASMPHVEEYLRDLARRGFARPDGPRLQLAPVHEWGVGTDAYEVAVSAFAEAETRWFDLAIDLGLGVAPLPGLATEPCSAGRLGTETIDPNGVVHDCPEFPLRQNEPVFLTLGRAPQRDARARPNGALMDDMTWNTKIESPPCRQCSLLPVCGGACALSRARGQAQCPSMKHNFPDRIDAAVRQAYALAEPAR